ncbi:hypothetical protein EYB45_05540 [Erythrobacteraceae bacterium CFH 75059]|uniref:3TM-type holin n=1 Tax=Qipengyuania thermophila TaxID=2509361 RepID=UPI00101F4FC6|nr:3TM-type holin [Qipengyuania thermophila]TCD04990.1 hypothetical protein EYB45_05540 [Erythrobacteraceae bacterium CFH 75059]
MSQHSLIPPLSTVIDRVVDSSDARAAAKLALLRLGDTREFATLARRIANAVSPAPGRDPLTNRARPAFLYAMYVILLAALPLAALGALSPAAAEGAVHAATLYLRSLPQELYTLFGTGYLGYTAARQWGKIKGVDG